MGQGRGVRVGQRGRELRALPAPAPRQRRGRRIAGQRGGLAAAGAAGAAGAAQRCPRELRLLLLHVSHVDHLARTPRAVHLRPGRVAVRAEMRALRATTAGRAEMAAGACVPCAPPAGGAAAGSNPTCRRCPPPPTVLLVIKFFSLLRTNAAPLPGLTCRNSTTWRTGRGTGRGRRRCSSSHLRPSAPVGGTQHPPCTARHQTQSSCPF